MYGGNIYASVEYASRQRIRFTSPTIVVGPFSVRNFYGLQYTTRNPYQPEGYDLELYQKDFTVRLNENQ